MIIISAFVLIVVITAGILIYQMNIENQDKTINSEFETAFAFYSQISQEQFTEPTIVVEITTRFQKVYREAKGEEYYKAMANVIKEIFRIMKKDRYMALYVSDSYKKDYPFMAIGFRLFEILNKYFIPIDIISVVRHNKTLSKGNYHISALENNYYLRGFNYLFVMYKIGIGDNEKIAFKRFIKYRIFFNLLAV